VSDEPRVVLPVEAEAVQLKVRADAAQSPDDVPVRAGDQVDGIAEPCGQQVVAVGVLVDRVDVAVVVRLYLVLFFYDDWTHI